MRMKRNACDHDWNFLHSVWATKDDDNSGNVAVARYCPKCGKQQTATASNWRNLPKGYVDMREALNQEQKL